MRCQPFGAKILVGYPIIVAYENGGCAMYENYQLMKFISIINRQANRYYNKKLSASKIGCGQYFFFAACERK